MVFFFFFQAEDGIRDLVRSRGLGDVYKRQPYGYVDVEKDLVFTREEVATFGSNQQVYNWGIYALSLIHI